MKYKDGFKVVYKLDYLKIKEIKYISFNRRPAIEVEYIPNIPTTRKSKPMNIYTDEHENEYILGPFAVFDNYEHARYFARDSHCLRVFKCKYIPSKEKTLYFIKKETDKKYEMDFGFPRGTVFADEVIITEEI